MTALRSAATLIAMTATLAACGDDGGTGPSDGGSKTMQATVAGEQWSATGAVVVASYTNNVLQIAGSDLKAGVTTQINLSLPNVTTTGAIQLGPSFTGTFATVTISQGTTPSVWTTLLSPATGSVNISTLTEDRVVGTFNFTAQASAAPATGQKAVTSGTFDIEF